MKNGKDKLIVAIDTDNFDKAKELIDQLEDSVDIFKVGLEQYVATKGKTLEYLKEKGKKVFLDLKFHDIPNTMKSAIILTPSFESTVPFITGVSTSFNTTASKMMSSISGNE